MGVTEGHNCVLILENYKNVHNGHGHVLLETSKSKHRNQMTELTFYLSCNSGHQPRNAFHAVTTKQRFLKGINIDLAFDFNHMINTENCFYVLNHGRFQFEMYEGLLISP